MHRILSEAQKIVDEMLNQSKKKVGLVEQFQNLVSYQGNEFLLLIKAEVFKDPSNLTFAFHEFSRILTNFDVDLVATKVMSKSYIKANKLIDKNYPTLSMISSEGWAGLHPIVQKRVHENFSVKPIEVLGGDQALQLLPGVTSAQLREHCDAKGTIKLGSGAYACHFGPYVLLNGFFPFQRNHLSEGILMACIARSRHSWLTLRNSLVGTINPATAALGSLRRTFYDLKIGVQEIATNGFHISPGPIEAAWQIKQFFSDTNFCSSFVQQLQSCGWSPERINSITSNPSIEEDHLFELTEGFDSAEALAYVKKLNMDTALPVIPIFESYSV